jgi:hypothetical protein
MAISRVYAINNIEEEWNVHSGHLLRSSDTAITAEVVDFVKACPRDQILPNYQAAGVEQKYAVVLALADASTVHIQVPVEITDLVKTHFSDKKLVELVAAVALHNAVARVFGAFDVNL